jgi:hypothetical protein
MRYSTTLYGPAFLKMWSADYWWSAGGFGRKSIAKIVSYTQRMKKTHPYMSVLKLPLLIDLQREGLSIASCSTIIILENALN